MISGSIYLMFSLHLGSGGAGPSSGGTSVRNWESELAKMREMGISDETLAKKALTLMGGDIQDLQMSYVQVSRAKNTTRLYAQCIDESPQHKIESLIKDIEYSRIKDMAVHIKERSREYEL